MAAAEYGADGSPVGGRNSDSASADAAPRVVKRTVAFDTPWFQVIAKTVAGLPGATGQEPYFAVQPSDYVTVVALTADRHLVMVRQYRPTLEQYTLELPSGNVDSGESPEDAARRELLEETGYGAQEITLLGRLMPDSGRLSNSLWCYLVNPVLAESAGREPGLECILQPIDDVSKLIASGEFTHALHLAALMLAMVKAEVRLRGPGQERLG